MTTEADMAEPTLTVESVGASVLLLPRIERKAPRAYIVGSTDTGKSTLMEVLMRNYQAAYSIPKFPVRTLIVDTKPRFKALYELSGITTLASRRYAKWGYGSGVIPGSFVVPGTGRLKSELDQVWRLGGTVAIVQSESKTEWDLVSAVAEAFYEGYGAQFPRLLVVDELADFYEFRSLGDIFQRVARNGRERDVALIAGSQRPRKVPVEIMTEMRRLYMFELQSYDDLKHLMGFGLPRLELERNGLPTDHTFYMYDRKLRLEAPSNMYYELDLSINYYTGKKYERPGES
jgi:DNA helicase HerA-like ATPase